MGVRGHELVRVSAALLLLAAGASGCARGGAAEWRTGSEAVVLRQAAAGSQLVIVDLDRFAIEGRIPLKSLSLSIDGDPGSRTVVTAQCGGPGVAAGREAGVFRLGRDASPRYVRLPVPNPSDVVVAAGYAHVVHGFEQTAGVCVSSFSVAEWSPITRRHVPVTSQRPERAAGAAALPYAAASSEGSRSDGRLTMLGPSAISDVATGLPTAVLTVVSGVGAETLVVAGSPGTGWSLASVDRRGRVGESRALPRIEKGVFSAARSGREVALADSDAIDLNDPGRRVLVVDADSGRLIRRISVGGTPSAVGWWGRRLLVVDGLRGELLEYRASRTEPARQLVLGGSSGGTADLVVFPAGGDARE